MAVDSPRQQLTTTETHLLEMLGHGAPMLEVLNELCNFIDARSPGAISTVFLLDNDGMRLRPVAGPKAPKTWKEEIDSVEVGPYAGFCSTAGDQGRALTVGDIHGDPLFAVHREAALREGLQMASFRPILSMEKQILGALALSYPQRQQRWPEPDSELLERAIYLAAIAIECYRNEQELREFSRRLSQSQDDERRRIARELHDSTGQKLAVLAMNLALVQNQVRSSGTEFSTMIAECSALTKDISEEVRTLSYMMHPPLLDECGLETAIQMYSRGINRREGLDVTLEIPRRLQRLSEDAELAVFRIVQASLTNIHLHSGSVHANVKIEQIPEGLAITISDHGRGIPKAVLDSSPVSKGTGVGIAGMKERVKYLGGRLEIESSEYGTKVKATIPSCHFRSAKSTAAAAGYGEGSSAGLKL
ncbi:MAG TPA: GAF domain-containing sensor histidine kinase [Candidatus Acidoferrum sp.]